VSVAQNPTDGAKAFSLSGTRLAFPTIADYRAAIDNPTAAAETSLLTTINAFANFTSWNEKFVKDTLYKNTLFPTILNGDGVVQIGTNIFRVDKTYAKVFVLPLADIAYYNDLIATYPQSGKVYMFSTDDEVLDMIETEGALNQTVVSTVDLLPVSGVKGLFSIKIKMPEISIHVCRENGVRAGTASRPFFFQNGILTVQYNKNGIEFNLNASVPWTGIGSFPYMFQFTGGIDKNQGYIYYHVKCKQTISTEYTTDGTRSLSYENYTAYRSSRALNTYYFGCRMLTKSSPTVVSSPQSEYAIIRGNM
jgi:hypothetical protein